MGQKSIRVRMRSNKQGKPTWHGIQVLLVADDFCLGNCCHAWLNHDDCNHSDSCHGDRFETKENINLNQR